MLFLMLFLFCGPIIDQIFYFDINVFVLRFCTILVIMKGGAKRKGEWVYIPYQSDSKILNLMQFFHVVTVTEYNRTLTVTLCPKITNCRKAHECSRGTLDL